MNYIIKSEEVITKEINKKKENYKYKKKIILRKI